jgi:riboflavin kinase/FMN adenylyltransferase
MRVIRGLHHEAPPFRSSVVTLGNYDGVHRGHQRILQRLREAAEEHGAESVVMLFDPHPVRFLRPDKEFHLITRVEDRLALLDEQGVDATLVIPFDARVAEMEAEDFVRDVLAGLLGARHIVLGGDSRFGHGRRGDVAMLREMGQELGFAVELVDTVEVAGARVSSSAVRRAVASGDVALASQMLGRPFFVTGTVVGGDGRGRLIGFPTANVEPDVTLAPKPGVYECRILLDGETAPRVAVVNVGHRPTFGARGLRIEAHVLDFTGDLYGVRIRLSFVRRLRDEQRFSGVDELVAQIGLDVEAVRRGAGPLG